MLRLLRIAASGSDLFADLGSVAGKAVGLALAPFALYFSVVGLLTPLICLVVLLVERDWQLSAMLLAAGLGHGVAGCGLSWFALRLYRGTTSANGVTVLPTWLVRTFLLLFAGPLSFGLSAVCGVQAYHSGRIHEWPMAAMLAALSIGFTVGALRGSRTAFALKDGRSSDDHAVSCG